MKKLILIFVVVLLGCTGTEKNTKEDPRFNGLEARIDSLLTAYHAVGLAVAVVEKGTTIYANGFGYRDFEQKLPVDANTTFGIGSCTKAFTAAALGVMREDDKLAFTDAPSKYVKDLSFYSKGMNDSIQIEHLLTHSSGVGNRSSESTAIVFETNNARELVPRIKYLKPSAGVARELSYNNLMYALASMVGEEITDNTWAEEIEQSLFNPIGMSRSVPYFEPAVTNGNYSLGYAVDSIFPAQVLGERMATRGPAGAIFSSVNDMSLWLKTWLNEGKIGGKQVLPASYVADATAERMLWPSNPNDSIPGPDKYYGYGWLTWVDQGIRRIEHSGGVSGYGSNVVFFPESDIGLVVLTNQTASSLAGTVTDEIIARILPNLKTEPLQQQFSQVHTILPMDIPTTINEEFPPTQALADLVGNYYHPGYGTVNVTHEDKTLYANFPMTKMRLSHHEHNVFYDHYTEDVPLVMWNFMRLDFQENADGGIDVLMINLDPVPVHFKKVFP